jgi:CRISPR-associated protein Csb2
MKSFSLVIEYLTGYAVATDATNREQAEWPPHPARIFMALAAAHFETDGSPEQKRTERDALEWLAALSPPDVTAPEHTLREVQTVYVPVNDQTGGEALLRRSRQPRLFPRVHIGDEPLRQTWHVEDERSIDHLIAIESICRNVTRIGHSSSLVWVRLERDASVEPTHVPDEQALEKGLRITQPGALRRLEEAFNKSATDEFFALEEQVNNSKGKAKQPLQQKLNEQFPRGQPTFQRPVFSISRGYRQVVPVSIGPLSSPFDANFIVLREADDATQTFGLESTAQITHALRNFIMRESLAQPVPPWVGGHEPNGQKLESESHMALIPLAFIGHERADGHLMGVGIMLPRNLSFRDRAKVLSSILFDDKTNEPKILQLTMGIAGAWKIVRETSLSPKRTLQTLTYVGPSRSWASVTPVVLDRMPKKERVKDAIGWREEVAGIVAQSCRNVGLPEPVAVRVEKTPFFRGSLRAMPGQGGFPQLRSGRFQVHAAIEFDRPVRGPVLLGAGRFRGYGLMRPWADEVGR